MPPLIWSPFRITGQKLLILKRKGTSVQSTHVLKISISIGGCFGHQELVQLLEDTSLVMIHFLVNLEANRISRLDKNRR